ncbi:hypothetical protein [Clostridium sp.]|uniref:hypothetical protein n=1 Tax=Clostridium sp. TaxID=1506 RepID=UPI003F2B4109
MTSIKRIGFFGKDTEDIMIYLATFLKKLDKSVSMIDLTGDLKFYFEDDGQEVITLNDIDIFFNEEHFQEQEYDLILINFGYDNQFKSQLFETDLNFMVTDIQKKSILQLKEMLDKQQILREYIKVFRDIVDTKITKEYLDLILGSTHNTIEEYFLYLNSNELENKIKLQYYNEVDFKTLPQGFKQMLRGVVEKIEFEQDPKILAKKIKKIERGKEL